MNYDFHTLYSSNTAFNCDVVSEGKDEYMGRLYILTAEEPKLLNLGIEKEWFLAHTQGQFLVCGHINADGQWSLSSYKSLEPSLRYTTQSEIFDRVFSTDYVREVLQLRNELDMELQQPILLNNGADDSNDESSDATVTKVYTNFSNNENISIDKLDILRDLLLRLSPLELKEFEEAGLHTQESTVTIVTLPQESVLIEEIQKVEISEIQDALIEKVLEDYQQHNTSEFILTDEATVTIHVEENYFVLLSTEDGHTILSATIDGEVLDELKEVDARQFAFILQQQQAPLQLENSTQQLQQAPKTQNPAVDELTWG